MITITLQKCLIKDEKYDFVVTTYRQTIGFNRSKRQTRKNTIMTINTNSESDTTTI